MRYDDLGYDAPAQEPDAVTPVLLPFVLLVLASELAWHLCQAWGWFK